MPHVQTVSSFLKWSVLECLQCWFSLPTGQPKIICAPRLSQVVWGLSSRLIAARTHSGRRKDEEEENLLICLSAQGSSLTVLTLDSEQRGLYVSGSQDNATRKSNVIQSVQTKRYSNVCRWDHCWGEMGFRWHHNILESYIPQLNEGQDILLFMCHFSLLLQFSTVSVSSISCSVTYLLCNAVFHWSISTFYAPLDSKKSHKKNVRSSDCVKTGQQNDGK